MDSSLDDLASFGSDGILSSEDKKLHHNDVSLPSSPLRRPASPVYNPMGLTIGQISPGVRSFSSDKSSFARNESNFIVNAVHMHVQENAKIPNYNKAVDRSVPHHSLQNSSMTTMAAAEGTGQFQEDQFLQDFSMAELFLSKESSTRKSLNQNYEHSRSINTSSAITTVTTANGRLGTIDDTSCMEIDALTAAIDPTPWSEIEDKIFIECTIKQAAALEHRHQHPRRQNHILHHHMMDPPSEINNHPHQSSYYPYGRHHQLPIPERIHSPPKQTEILPISNGNSTTAINGIHKNDGMADAIATAAAIVASTAVASGPVPTGAESIDKRRFPSTSIAANPTACSVQHTESAQMSSAHSTNPTDNSSDTSNHNPSTKTATNTLNSSVSVRPRHLQRQRGNSATPPTHAAAHSLSRASVLAAASRKSQYGFGENHTVPSVPAPPPIHGPRPKVVSAATSNHHFPKNGTNIAAGPTIASVQNQDKIPIHVQEKKMPRLGTTAQNNIYLAKQPKQIPTLPPSLQNGNHFGNSGAAYERKKQRAKDARVKLNESIDKLSISISLAASQASERINQLQNSAIVTDSRQRTIESNEACLKLAEQAKKWDRPSFVGTAASLIQALNGQCEALMAELEELQQKSTSHGVESSYADNHCPSGAPVSIVTDTFDGTNSSNASTKVLPFDPRGAGAKEISSTEGQTQEVHNNDVTLRQMNESPSLASEHKRPEQPTDTDGTEPVSKKARLDPTIGTDALDETEPLSDDTVIFNKVAKFLDPKSLCNSVRVCKVWRDIQGFTHDDVWLKLLINRFGFFNVRQWSERFEDGEAGGEKQVSSKTLYREMDGANVMPHITNQDGMLTLLGEATIPGRVSGWVFLVERSNGETLRSVKQQPGTSVNFRAYHSRPVVELRMIVQNTGMANRPMVLKKQVVSVDVSTRRSGGELMEIDWDDRFKKVVKNIDGTLWQPKSGENPSIFAENHGELCCLNLFDTVVLELHILATGCSTTSKFRQRSNFTKLLVSLDGTTVPMVIPFLRDHNSNLH